MKNVDIIDKIKQEKNLVLLGKNGVGKTYSLAEIHNNPEVDTIFVDFNLSERYDELLRNLISTRLISTNPSMYNKAKGFITKSVDEIEGILTSFDSKQSKNKHDLVDSKHKLQLMSGDILENTFSLKYEYNNGMGIDYFLKLQLLLEILDTGKEVVLLIDEPEKYCFPGLIQRLARILATHRVQVICASHSPVFVNAFINDFSELIFLKQKNENYSFSSDELIDISYTTYAEDLNNKYFSSKGTIISNKERFKTFFRNLLKFSLIESLYSDVTIITEGATDKQLVDYILRTDEDFYNMNVIQSNGKDMFPVYISVLKKYKIAIFSVFDLDNNKNDLHITYNDFIKENSTSYYYFPNNIEESFELGEKASGEKAFVGPTILLVKLLDNAVNTQRIINEIRENLKISYLSSVVGRENLKFEISKLAKELNGIEDDTIQQNISKYLMLNELTRKSMSLYGDYHRNIAISMELKLSYFYLKNTLRLTNMESERFAERMEVYRENALYNEESIEFIFCVERFDRQNKEFSENVLNKLPLKEVKSELLLDCYAKKDVFYTFESYLSDMINSKLKGIESTYFAGEVVLSDLEISQKLSIKQVVKALKERFKDKKLLERNQLIDEITNSYSEVLRKVI